ncbi:NarK family nitrate/nitrite MFS transporter [Streptomyces sodiiphilus]|uniref:NarK family nitrate/nitrite MFS transporter n=1 Tax=Streptomyces sodiiphilus TaxID=226217 RepID=A0ABN2P3L4_9ACTN
MRDRRRAELPRWDPENETFWEQSGRRVARRNLLLSVLTEHIGFSVWSIWSVLVLFMSPELGMDFTPDQKFLLVIVPTVVGALLRLPYSWAVVRFGGRNWTVFATLILLVPATGAWWAVQRPGTPFWVFLVIAALGGAGGGNFASSMTNITRFFPHRHQGWALGLNAGGGNAGVAAVHIVGLLVIAVFGDTHPALVAATYLPLIVVASLVAALAMDNLPRVQAGNSPDGSAGGEGLRAAARSGHTWWISLLYIGTFGSFIGYGFAFGLVLQTQFGVSALEAASWTFLGPLLGSISRPVGGWCADRWGGARVSLVLFALMGLGTVVLLVAGTTGSLAVFAAGFIALFVLSGAGNGSVYKLLPVAFAREAASLPGDRAAALARARLLAGAAMGISGAIGALGGAGINLVLRASYSDGGSGTLAFSAFLAWYAVCAFVVWQRYLRTDDMSRPAGRGTGRLSPRDDEHDRTAAHV